MAADKTIRVTLVKSLTGRNRDHIACAYGIGLKKINQTADVEDTPANRGMINKIAYLVRIEE